VLRDSLDMLIIEGDTTPRMMSVGLHTRIGGRPGVAIALRRFLQYALAQEGVWFATREQIARWWLANGPRPDTARPAADQRASGHRSEGNGVRTSPDQLDLETWG